MVLDKSASDGLTPLEILGIAIKSEIEAARVYETLYQKVKNTDLKKKLEFLKGEEEKHGAILEELYTKSYPEVKLKLPEKSLLPEMEITLSEDTPVVVLFEKAMEAEKVSEEFYKEAADRMDNPQAKVMLGYLSGMERSHYSILRTEYDMIQTFEDYYLREKFTLEHIGP